MRKYAFALASFFTIALVFASPHLSYAFQALENFPFITTQELNMGIENKSVFVVDCNTPETYREGHIPNAVHLDTTNPEAKLLPVDKNTPLVFYCKEPRCMAGHYGAGFAKKLGYAHIRVYSLGIDGWKKAGLKTDSDAARKP